MKHPAQSTVNRHESAPLAEYPMVGQGKRTSLHFFLSADFIWPSRATKHGHGLVQYDVFLVKTVLSVALLIARLLIITYYCWLPNY